MDKLKLINEGLFNCKICKKPCIGPGLIYYVKIHIRPLCKNAITFCSDCYYKSNVVEEYFIITPTTGLISALVPCIICHSIGPFHSVEDNHSALPFCSNCFANRIKILTDKISELDPIVIRYNSADSLIDITDITTEDYQKMAELGMNIDKLYTTFPDIVGPLKLWEPASDTIESYSHGCTLGILQNSRDGRFASFSFYKDGIFNIQIICQNQTEYQTHVDEWRTHIREACYSDKNDIDFAYWLRITKLKLLT
jgi:hypothetical protein